MIGAGDPAGAHCVHGMGLAMEAPTWPAITLDEAAAVLASFPDASALEALHWHSPRPFSAATLVHTSGGSLLLKRHDRRVRSVAGLAEEHGFIAHLAAAGMPVPDLLRTGEGASAIVRGDWTYELHRQALGEDLYRDRLSWTPFQTGDHARAAGVALAQLHRASEGYDAPARAVQPLVASFSILSAADPMAAAQAYINGRPALAEFLRKRNGCKGLVSLFATLGEGLAPGLARQKPLWTHNDWHPSNLLWSADGGVETVFDFGLADRTCAVHELATAIERTAFAWLELGERRDDHIGDPVAALSLIAGYETLRPLDAVVKEAIVRLLPLVHIEFALSEIDYFAGVVGDADPALLAWEGYLLGHAEWFQSFAGQDFLARLRIGLDLT
jgi:Ser/Thr protein kinase RdoA (MazF antagonist)